MQQEQARPTTVADTSQGATVGGTIVVGKFPLPGLTQVPFTPGMTARDALRLANVNVGEGEELRVGSKGATLDTEVALGQNVTITKRIQGAQ